MFEFTLKDGISVHASHFSFSATYSGLLEGDPSKSNWINDNVLKRLHCPRDWGTRKTLIITPETENGFLPPVIYYAWLNCYTPINPEMHGSELVVIWLGKEPGEKNLETIIYEGIYDLNWKEEAADFEY